MIKRLLIGSGMAGALVTAFLLGSVALGVVGAQPATPAPAAQATTENDANHEDQHPSYTGSIAVPQDQKGQTEQDESNTLASMAKITADQAKQAALAPFPGATVTKVELDNENGYLVYSVRLTDASGKAQEVKVDAGDGRVLATEAADSEHTGEHGGLEESATED